MRTLAAVALALVFAAPALASGSPVAGKVVFKAECGSCHAFKAAGTSGKSPNHGPALDGKRVSASLAMSELSGATGGTMPTFVGVLTQKQINDVVAFVVKMSKPGAKL